MQSQHGSGSHDFDFFMGSWRVQHRRLKERLVDNHEWEEFGGTTTAQAILGGFGNIDDNEIELPGGAYRAVTLRTFDPDLKRWSIWWLDGRYPNRFDPPVVGSFEDGTGAFYGEDTLNGEANPRPLSMDGDGIGFALLGAGVLLRYRQILGNQLDHEFHAVALSWSG